MKKEPHWHLAVKLNGRLVRNPLFVEVDDGLGRKKLGNRIATLVFGTKDVKIVKVTCEIAQSLSGG